MIATQITRFAWGLTAMVSLVGVLAWQQSIVAPIGQLTLYQVFPVFGILAFSIMWAHYMVGAAVRYYQIEKSQIRQYYSLSALVVLGALLLHPGLLMWQLWRDGIGLPVNYVAPDLRLFVILGQIALVLFLAYELHRRYESRAWWRYIARASDVAMVLVLVHGFWLGRNLWPTWYMVVWGVYGVTYLAAVTYASVYRYRTSGQLL